MGETSFKGTAKLKNSCLIANNNCTVLSIISSKIALGQVGRRTTADRGGHKAESAGNPTGGRIIRYNGDCSTSLGEQRC